MTYKEIKIEECKKTYPYCVECSQYHRCGIRITLFGDIWDDIVTPCKYRKPSEGQGD